MKKEKKHEKNAFESIRNERTMNAKTSTTISNLPYTKREIRHCGRNRRGFHVYLSMFFYDFKQLDNENQEEALCRNGVWSNNIDATMSLLTPPRPSLFDILRCKDMEGEFCLLWESESN